MARAPWLAIYRWALRSFPSEFRARYGREMEEALRDSVASRRTAGRGSKLLIAQACLDAVWQGSRERMVAWRRQRREHLAFRQERSVVRNLISDIRYALRGLRRAPGFAAITIFTLALGIGANAAIFSVVNGVVLRPLPYPDSDELVMLFHWFPEVDMRASVSVPAFQDYQEMNRVFSGLTAITGLSANLTGSGEPVRIQGISVSHEFFGVLGIEPALGRTFFPEEDVPGANRVVVISDALWQRQFGGDPDILRRDIMLDNAPHTIVGVMPPGFAYPGTAELWRPIAFTDALINGNRGQEFLGVIGRTKPGTSFEQVEADMATITARLEPEYYSWTTGWRVLPIRLIDVAIGQIRPVLWTLFAAVGAVLLITMVNVANLILARASSREQEVALRVALGGSRLAAIRHALTESVVLSLLGGVAGLGVATVMLRGLVALNPGNIPRMQEVSIDPAVLGFTFALALATGVLFGTLPALRAAKANPRDVIAAGGSKASMSRKGLGAQRTLVVAEVALALLLLAGAGLMMRSLDRLLDVDPGFDPTQVLALDLTLSPTAYPDVAARTQFFQRLLAEVSAQPGVLAVAAINAAPFSGRNPGSSFGPQGYDFEGAPGLPQSSRRVVTPGYFNAMDITLLAGRDFTQQDMMVDAPPVIIVDQHTVDDFWPGEDPIGKWIGFSADGPEYIVVGVVENIRHQQLDQPSRYHIYNPLGQSSAQTMTVLVQGRGDPTMLATPVRQVVGRIDPTQAIFRLQPMTDYLRQASAQARFNAMLLGLFALVALVLASVGVYGVMSYAMSRRTQEIGIRMALGAETSVVLRQLVGRGLVPALAGVALGLMATVVATRFMASLLFGVSPTDPATLLAVAGVLLAVGVAACYLPARRATRIDPMEALRYE